MDTDRHRLREESIGVQRCESVVQKEEQQEAAVVAQGLAKVATLLAGRNQWVITNVPYPARGKQNERLRDFCERHYSAAKNDLATVFLDRCLELCVEPQMDTDKHRLKKQNIGVNQWFPMAV